MEEKLFFEWTAPHPKAPAMLIKKQVLESTLLKVAATWLEVFMENEHPLWCHPLEEDRKQMITDAFVTGAKSFLLSNTAMTDDYPATAIQNTKFRDCENDLVLTAFRMGAKLAWSNDGWQIPVGRAYTTGAFIEPVEVVINGEKQYRWIVTGFEDDTYFKGIVVDLNITGISVDDLVNEIPATSV